MGKYRLPLFGLGTIILLWVIHLATSQVQQLGGIAGHTTPAIEGPSLITRSLRPVYPYSVISGGAYSPGELQYRHAKDPVVQAHYSDFNVKQAHLVTLTDDRFQYASYRVKDQIFWTKKRLRIPKGELLLTDGTNYARARCGNRLSSVPNTHTGPHEPDSAMLTMPNATPDMLPKMSLSIPPALDDIPASGLVPVSPQTNSGLPSGMEDHSVINQSAHSSLPFPDSVPLATGFSSGSPIVAGGGGGSPGSPGHPGTPGTPPIPVVPLVPGTPTVPGVPTTPGTPIVPPTPSVPITPNQPPDPTPIPEPNTVYLFLVTLVISVVALLRMSPKDESD